jgi:hypothetical protein
LKGGRFPPTHLLYLISSFTISDHTLEIDAICIDYLQNIINVAIHSSKTDQCSMTAVTAVTIMKECVLY